MAAAVGALLWGCGEFYEEVVVTIIAVANQKGGVGKTTLAVHLAVYAAEHGRRVVLVDADPQGNASSWLLDGDTTQDGLFQLLVVGKPALSLVRAPAGWPVKLLPGNYRTGEAFTFLAATGKPFGLMAELLRPLGRVVDLVFVDVPPSRNAGFRELLLAADWVLAPTQVERLSLEGVAFMARTCQELGEQFGQGPRLLGVVPNMARRGVNEHQDQMAGLVATFGATVWPPIPLSIRVPEACSFGTTCFVHARDEAVTAAFRRVGERFLENVEGGTHGK